MCVCLDVYVSCLAALLWFDNASHLIYFNEAQTESRLPWGHVVLCVYSNMLAISAAFILKDQSKLPSQGCRVGNTCNMCTVNWMVFQHWPSLSSRSSHTHTHINTANADTYRKPDFSELSKFKAWPANFFIVSRVQWLTNTHTQTHTYAFLPSLPLSSFLHCCSLGEGQWASPEM